MAAVNLELTAETRRRILQHVLQEVHPDRLEVEVVGVAPRDGDLLVGVKARPRGYLSAATYALVTVDDDLQIVDSEPCTGLELQRALEGDG